jgi:hypothetical protein
MNLSILDSLKQNCHSGDEQVPYTKHVLMHELAAQQGRYVDHMPGWYRKQFLGWPKEIERAWEIYNHARVSSLDILLLGGMDMREDVAMLRNFGTTRAGVEPPVVLPRDRTTAAPVALPVKYTGSILREGKWWLMPNDAWVLGGVHGYRQFHVAGDLTWIEENLWDDKFKRPSVLGRELFGLFLFGYCADASYHKMMGVVLFVEDGALAASATFTKYLDGIEGGMTSTKDGFFEVLLPWLAD